MQRLEVSGVAVWYDLYIGR